MDIAIKVFLSIALLLSLQCGATAQTTTPQSQSNAEPSQEMIELRRAGYAANYNLDYPTARAKFEEIRKRWPNHPAGDLYVANIIWLEHLYKLRRLQTGLYQNESAPANARPLPLNASIRARIVRRRSKSGGQRFQPVPQIDGLEVPILFSH